MVQAGSFYLDLARPTWAPPAWLFGPVWSVLYVLMGVAAWLVWRVNGGSGARRALKLFIAQLAVNALWTWLFFVWRQGGLAFAEVLLLWAMILATVVLFGKVASSRPYYSFHTWRGCRLLLHSLSVCGSAILASLAKRNRMRPNPAINTDAPPAALRVRSRRAGYLDRWAHSWRRLLAHFEDCKHEAGAFRPVIDRKACEGKADCERVCPVSVFSVGTLPKRQRAYLSLKGKLKGFAHKWQQAILTNESACQACGLCVKACPEHAITLSRT